MNDKDDDFFPGFQEEGSPAAKPSVPVPEPAPQAKQGGFDPFADEPVANPGATPAAEAPAAAPSNPAGASAGVGAQIMSDMATESGDADGDEGEIKPGQGKDLWECPHCGAKNKPKRETCRACGKKPTDPIEKPWFMKPGPLAGIAGAVVVVVVVVMMMGGTNLSYKAPSVSNIDAEVRMDTSGGSATVDGVEFTARGKLAVTGVVFGFTPAMNGEPASMVLALGEQAQQTEKIGSMFIQGDKVMISGGIGDTEVDSTRLYLHGWTQDSLQNGAVLSVMGYWGDTDKKKSNVGAQVYVIAVQKAGVSGG